jgi:hypothetical protein
VLRIDVRVSDAPVDLVEIYVVADVAIHGVDPHAHYLVNRCSVALTSSYRHSCDEGPRRAVTAVMFVASASSQSWQRPSGCRVLS